MIPLNGQSRNFTQEEMAASLGAFRGWISMTKQEQAAASRGNKSVIESVQKRESIQGEWSEEELAFLKELEDKMGKVADGMSGLSRMFEDREKREEKKAREERSASRMRKVGGLNFGKGGLSRTLGDIVFGEGGGYGSGGSGSSGTGDTGDSSFLDKLGSLGSDVAETLAGNIGYDALKKALGKTKLGKILNKVPKAKVKLPRDAGGRFLPKSASKMGRLSSFGKGLAGSKALPIVGTLVTLGVGAHQVVSAKREAKDAAWNLASDVKGTDAASLLARQGIQNGLVVDDTIARTQAQGAGGALSAVGAGATAGMLFGPLGAALGGLVGGVVGALAGDWLAGRQFDRILGQLGLTREDVELATRAARGEDVLGELQNSVNTGERSKEQVEIITRRLEKAMQTMVLGLGDYTLPETWPAEFSIPGGTSTNPDAVKTLPGIFRKPLHEAVMDYHVAILKTLSESDQYQRITDPRKKSMFLSQGIAKNKARIGMGAEERKNYPKEVEKAIGYDKPGLPFAGNNGLSPYATGLAVDIQSTQALFDNLKKRGIRRIKGDPLKSRFFNTTSPEFAKLVESGLWTENENGMDGLVDGKKLVPVIKANQEPEYLALGGILNRATSLGYADGISPLETAGNEIASVLKTGLESISPDDGSWFDDALMGYFMDGLLPGLVSALKNEKNPVEQGMTVPVEVFG